MRTTAAALLCASLLVGGPAAAAESHVQPDAAILGGLVLGKTDLKPYLNRLKEDGCGFVFLEFLPSTKVPGKCFGLPAESVVFRHHQLEPQRTVAGSVTVTFVNAAQNFDAFARSLRKKYGPGSTPTTPGAARRLFWETDGMTIRLWTLPDGSKGGLEYVSKALEERLQRLDLEKMREESDRMDSML